MARTSCSYGLMHTLGCLLLIVSIGAAARPLQQKSAATDFSQQKQGYHNPAALAAQLTTVPDLVGVPGSQAVNALRNSHLAPGVVTTKDETGSEKGFVLSQDPLPDPNKKVLFGTKVNLVVGWPEILLNVDESAQVGTPVSASVTMKPPIADARYRFEWGKDGKSPWQPDATATHPFATADTYTVTVEIVAADISLPTKTATVVVNPPAQTPEQMQTPGQAQPPKLPSAQPSKPGKQTKKPVRPPSTTNEGHDDGRGRMIALLWGGGILLVLTVGYAIHKWRNRQKRLKTRVAETRIVLNSRPPRYQMAVLKAPPKCLVRIRWVQKGSRGSIIPKGSLIKKKGAAHAG